MQAVLRHSKALGRIEEKRMKLCRRKYQHLCVYTHIHTQHIYIKTDTYAHMHKYTLFMSIPIF